MRAPLDLGPPARRRQAPSGAAASAGSTTKTRLERGPGSGTSVNGPVSVWNSVEVSPMRPACAEIEGQRGLRIAPAFGLDAGRGAAERTASVGADREPGRTGPPSASVTVTSRVARSSTASASSAISVSAGNSRARRVERREQVPVLDVVGRRPGARSRAAVEADLGRPQQPRRVVDDAHHAQRRRVFRAALPDAERLERRDRAREQCGGAVVVRRRRHRRPARSRRPLPASAIAAVRPAGPPPTTDNFGCQYRIMACQSRT